MARGKKRDGVEADPSQKPAVKRRRGGNRDAPDAPEADDPAEQIERQDVQVLDAVGAAPPDEEEGGNRRDNMAAIARRRAAHFAHFQADDEPPENNPHTGGSEARSLGPWSSAIQLVEARTAAAAARQGRISDAAKASIGGLADDSIHWEPKRDASQGERLSTTIVPLFQMGISLLVEHIEDVESLWGLPEVIKVKLAAAVCEARKMSPEIARLFTEGGPDEIVLPDCFQLNQEDLISVLTPAVTPRLERLELNMCGRGFGDQTAAALAAAGQLPGLRVLSLGGAYRLNDTGLLSLLAAAPLLEGLQLPQCCRLQGTALEQLPQLTPNLRVLDLADCRGLSAQSLRQILCGPANLARLEALTLDGIAEVDDQLLSEVCISLPQLARLSLNFCSLVTDAGLRGVAVGCGPRLTELRLDEVPKVTDDGLLALSEACLNLQVISLQRCHKVTDVGLASIASTGMLRVLGANKVGSLGLLTIKALVTACSDKLEEAELSWCRGVPSKALGMLADSCPNLRKLTLFGCSQIGKDFLHGHSNDKLVVVGATAQRSGAPEVAKLSLVGGEEEEAE